MDRIGPVSVPRDSTRPCQVACTSVSRRLGALVATVLVAVAIAHVFCAASTSSVCDARSRGTPRYLRDTFLHGDFGATDGGGCGAGSRAGVIALCATYGRRTGRRRCCASACRSTCAADRRPAARHARSASSAGAGAPSHPARGARASLHGATALQLVVPAVLPGHVVISTSPRTRRASALPFVSGQGDYVPFSEDPLGFAAGDRGSRGWRRAAAGGVRARITEASLRDDAATRTTCARRAPRACPSARVIEPPRAPGRRARDRARRPASTSRRC